MKKILFFALSIGFILSSCSNNDDEQSNEFSIIGVWVPSREIVNSGSNGITISNEPYSDCYQNSTFEFKSNNKMTSRIFESGSSGDCTTSGYTTVSYSYDGGAKKLIIDGENVEIISRTHNELQIVSDHDDVDGDGIDDKIILVLVK